MTDNNKVVWSEGLFLRPQHLQQQERYLERFVELRAGSLRPYTWGFSELELEAAFDRMMAKVETRDRDRWKKRARGREGEKA